jgi:phosphatidylserine/phosphatidylglycerophosphate/cardiolipin synthase-like enzyme
MAEFLTTRGITSAIENIINNAEKSLVLVSPFIKVSESLFQNLIAADKQGIRITLIFGKRELDDDVRKQLKQLKNLKVLFLENLHAKCYFNEKSMVITSLNLYDFSEQNNREIGVLVKIQDDENVYREALKEIQRIYKISSSYDLVNGLLEEGVHSASNTVKIPKESFIERFLGAILGQGYCIGCRTRIDFDEYKPYCGSCYKQWLKNKTRKAKYCHECGIEYQTTINKPLCDSCFSKSLNER